MIVARRMTERPKPDRAQPDRDGRHEERITLLVARAAEALSAPVAAVLRKAGLTQPQYNVLRILRGAAAEGLPCGEIGMRMIRRDPDLTRLLDRLEARQLVTRVRDVGDRRVVRASITDRGLDLLGSLDAPVLATHRRTLGHMPAERLRLLAELLEEARGGLPVPAAS
jgi:DNA-binding MarR family transcriptional regulator